MERAPVSESLRQKALRGRQRTRANYASRRPHQLFLLVSEGTKTERFYFEGFARVLPRRLLTIYGMGDNTLHVVQAAQRIQQARAQCVYTPNFDSIWPIFDRDDFPKQNFNNAVFKAVEKFGHCAYSIESFELWFLLHFIYVDARLHRHQINKKLAKYIGAPYQKARVDMYSLLAEKGDQGRAIQWAKRLFQKGNGQNPAEENPSTTVFQLVEILNTYRRHV